VTAPVPEEWDEAPLETGTPPGEHAPELPVPGDGADGASGATGEAVR
jgi:hypothetical protein